MAILTSHRSRFEGEETVELRVRTEQDTRLRRRLLRLPWKLYLSIVVLALMIVAPNVLLLRLNINNAPRVYLPVDAPSVRIDDRLRETFPSDQVLLMLFEGVALYSDGFLEALDGLARKLEGNPLIDKVMTVTTQDHIGGSDDGFSVTPLVDVEALENTRPAQRRQQVLRDRFARRSLVAGDGSALALLVIPQEIDESLTRLSLEDWILAQVEAARLTGYLQATAGQITVDVAQLRSMLRDNMTFIPATVVIGLLLIWWLFQRWIAVFLGGIAIGVIVSSTVAFYVLFDQPFNMISSIIPPLLSALTVATLVHLYNALHLASRRGYVGEERVRWALREIRRPALFTTLTTMAGLGSLGLSPIPPIRSFGLISAAGVVLIYLIVIVVLPNLFARFDFGPWPTRRSGMGAMDWLVKRLFHLGVRRPLPVVLVTLGLLLAATPQVFNVVVETNLQEFFLPGHPVRQSTDRVDEKLAGTTSLDVVFWTPREGGLKSPLRLAQIRAFQVWVEKLPQVDKSISHADFIEEMNWGFHAEDVRYRQVPTDPRLISQYLLVYDGDNLFDFVDREYRTAHVSLNLNVHSANRISEVMEQIRAYLGEHIDDGMSWEIAGFGRLFADEEDLLVQGQIYSLWGALALIFVLMLVQWRSLGAALLCMIPNLSPILLIFVVMGFFGIWLDMATAMIASVAVGIAVDDTIHVYHGFIQRVREGISPVVAIARTYNQAGRAVVTTTVILCAQFAILISSEFVPTAHFGLLTSVGLLAALFFDLTLLPALLVLIYGWRERPMRSRKPLEI
ncbi:MAG TPA: RND transporter [Sedimenticola sp.]|nr:RND transporter [Sedimenticola sp.]